VNLSTKDAWLNGPSDLKEAVVEDVPVEGQSVRVRGLPAAYSNQASSEALELKSDSRGRQSATVNTARMEVLQFAHGVIEPEFTVEEAEQIAERYGPAFKKVIERIDALSGVDKEAIKETNTRFRPGGKGEADRGKTEPAPNGAGDGGPAVRSRVGT
jgi:hypothetical protein